MGVDPDPDSEVIVTPLDPDGLNVVVTYVWGKGRTSPPSGEFVDVAAASWMSCGVRVDGSLACWPDLRFGEGTGKFGMPLPEGEFTQVALINGDYDNLGGGCALAVSGELACWSDPRHRREGVASDPPPGRFTDVRAMLDSWCAVRIDGGVVCWGDGFDGHEVLAESGYVSITDQFCALDAAGRLACWGGSSTPDSVTVLETSPDWAAPLGDHAHVRTGWLGADRRTACGITDALRSLVCWNRDTGERVLLEGFEGRYADIEAAHHHSLPDLFCAARIGGGLDCSGGSGWKIDAVVSDVPSGEFLVVEPGIDHVCAIRIDGTLACWGEPASKSSIG